MSQQVRDEPVLLRPVTSSWHQQHQNTTNTATASTSNQQQQHQHQQHQQQNQHRENVYSRPTRQLTLNPHSAQSATEPIQLAAATHLRKLGKADEANVVREFIGPIAMSWAENIIKGGVSDAIVEEPEHFISDDERRHSARNEGDNNSSMSSQSSDDNDSDKDSDNGDAMSISDGFLPDNGDYSNGGEDGHRPDPLVRSTTGGTVYYSPDASPTFDNTAAATSSPELAVASGGIRLQPRGLGKKLAVPPINIIRTDTEMQQQSASAPHSPRSALPFLTSGGNAQLGLAASASNLHLGLNDISSGDQQQQRRKGFRHSLASSMSKLSLSSLTGKLFGRSSSKQHQLEDANPNGIAPPLLSPSAQSFSHNQQQQQSQQQQPQQQQVIPIKLTRKPTETRPYRLQRKPAAPLTSSASVASASFAGSAASANHLAPNISLVPPVPKVGGSDSSFAMSSAIATTNAASEKPWLRDGILLASPVWFRVDKLRRDELPQHYDEYSQFRHRRTTKPWVELWAVLRPCARIDFYWATLSKPVESIALRPTEVHLTCFAPLDGTLSLVTREQSVRPFIGPPAGISAVNTASTMSGTSPPVMPQLPPMSMIGAYPARAATGHSMATTIQFAADKSAPPSPTNVGPDRMLSRTSMASSRHHQQQQQQQQQHRRYASGASSGSGSGGDYHHQHHSHNFISGHSRKKSGNMLHRRSSAVVRELDSKRSRPNSFHGISALGIGSGSSRSSGEGFTIDPTDAMLDAAALSRLYSRSSGGSGPGSTALRKYGRSNTMKRSILKEAMHGGDVTADDFAPVRAYIFRPPSTALAQQWYMALHQILNPAPPIPWPIFSTPQSGPVATRRLNDLQQTSPSASQLSFGQSLTIPVHAAATAAAISHKIEPLMCHLSAIAERGRDLCLRVCVPDVDQALIIEIPLLQPPSIASNSNDYVMNAEYEAASALGLILPMNPTVWDVRDLVLRSLQIAYEVTGDTYRNGHYDSNSDNGIEDDYYHDNRMQHNDGGNYGGISIGGSGNKSRSASGNVILSTPHVKIHQQQLQNSKSKKSAMIEQEPHFDTAWTRARVIVSRWVAGYSYGTGAFSRRWSRRNCLDHASTTLEKGRGGGHEEHERDSELVLTEIGVGWRRMDRIDWIMPRGQSEYDDKTGSLNSLLESAITPQWLEDTHELQVREQEHYPDSAKAIKRISNNDGNNNANNNNGNNNGSRYKEVELMEPVGVEGFLIKYPSVQMKLSRPKQSGDLIDDGNASANQPIKLPPAPLNYPHPKTSSGRVIFLATHDNLILLLSARSAHAMLYQTEYTSNWLQPADVTTPGSLLKSTAPVGYSHSPLLQPLSNPHHPPSRESLYVPGTVADVFGEHEDPQQTYTSLLSYSRHPSQQYFQQQHPQQYPHQQPSPRPVPANTAVVTTTSSSAYRTFQTTRMRLSDQIATAKGYIDAVEIERIDVVQMRQIRHVSTQGSHEHVHSTTLSESGTRFDVIMRDGSVIPLQAHSPAAMRRWVSRLRALRDYWRARLALDTKRRVAHAQLAMYAKVVPDSLLYNEMPLMQHDTGGNDAFRVLADPRVWSVCKLLGCRTIIMSGFLYRKSGRHKAMTRRFCVLTHGKLIEFDAPDRINILSLTADVVDGEDTDTDGGLAEVPRTGGRYSDEDEEEEDDEESMNDSDDAHRAAVDDDAYEDAQYFSGPRYKNRPPSVKSFTPSIPISISRGLPPAIATSPRERPQIVNQQQTPPLPPSGTFSPQQQQQQQQQQQPQQRQPQHKPSLLARLGLTRGKDQKLQKKHTASSSMSSVVKAEFVASKAKHSTHLFHSLRRAHSLSGTYVISRMEDEVASRSQSDARPGGNTAMEPGTTTPALVRVYADGTASADPSSECLFALWKPGRRANTPSRLQGTAGIAVSPECVPTISNGASHANDRLAGSAASAAGNAAAGTQNLNSEAMASMLGLPVNDVRIDGANVRLRSMGSFGALSGASGLSFDSHPAPWSSDVSLNSHQHPLTRAIVAANSNLSILSPTASSPPPLSGHGRVASLGGMSTSSNGDPLSFDRNPTATAVNNILSMDGTRQPGPPQLQPSSSSRPQSVNLTGPALSPGMIAQNSQPAATAKATKSMFFTSLNEKILIMHARSRVEMEEWISALNAEISRMVSRSDW
ncbi:hypothetical protein GQ42DRAFT_157962 [Ramicandelaber brevisporus]|nr:hypothetical protein GQ42DRAFT_157962 [Ramicandelaber brevisporus]